MRTRKSTTVASKLLFLTLDKYNLVTSSPEDHIEIWDYFLKIVVNDNKPSFYEYG